MNIIPAKIAGVPRIVVVTPPGTFQKNPLVAAALHELNAPEVYTVGGAQAVAALAYGTATIPRVEKIVGPGNAYVTAAKREVFGQVDIDMIAGPSEVVILATAESNPRFIAADMLSQAEHDEAACSICFTDSLPHAMLVQRELGVQLASLQRKEIARKSLESFGAIVNGQPSSVNQWINETPEHLEIFASILCRIGGSDTGSITATTL
jgi:histidinol dehydrogenase